MGQLSLPLPKGKYPDAKQDLLHGIWDNLSLINGATPSPNRNLKGGYSTSTEDILYQILLDLNSFAAPLRNKLQQNVNVRDFGAVGDGVTDDTAAFQAALDLACSANNPLTYGRFTPLRGMGNTVYIPHGYYKITDALLVKGSVGIFCERSNSYGGTRIQQVTPNKHLFHIIADTDGVSSGVSFIGGMAQTNPDIALIYGGDSAGDANNNSTYIANVTFATPETYAIRFKRGDDIKILDCTFDVSGTKSIGLGAATSTSQVTNFVISRCTFYDIRAGVIDLLNVKKGQIVDNKCYWDAAHRIPYFINVSANALTHLQVMANLLDGVDNLWNSNVLLDNVAITQNIATGAKGLTLSIGGGGINYRLLITDNQFDGDFSGTSAGQEKSPIFIYGTGLRYSLISGNVLNNTAGTLTKPIQFDVTRCEGTICTDNLAIGYTTYSERVAGYGYGTASPTQVPAYVGQEFINTTNGIWYKAQNTTASTDWKPQNYITRTYTLILGISSDVSVGTNITNQVTIENSGTIQKAWINAKTAPVGSDLIIDLKLNGTSIWATTTTNRLKLVNGASTGSQTSFDTTAVVAGQLLSLDVIQVGSTTPGQYVTVQLVIAQ